MNLRVSETGVGIDQYSTEFVCQRRRDETGILQLEKTAGTLLAGIYGRASEDAPWVLVSGRKHSNQTVVTLLDGSGYISELPIFPLMKVSVLATGVGATNTFKVWFVE